MTAGRRFQLACPLPLRHTTVQLAHGGGGRLMRELIEHVFAPAFDNPALATRHDAAVLDVSQGRIALTTDSYVVHPLFFPGGDIGKLAVYGTVNDLAMSGAVPRWLSAGFVLEEGFAFAELAKIVESMAEAAEHAGVSIVTGDTKVVDRGHGHGVYINTAGVGVVPEGVDIRPARAKDGDVVIVSGDLGRHGIAVLSVREGIAFGGEIESDCAPLAGVVGALVASGVELHFLRDLTRGGLAAALNELALDAELDIVLDEPAVPVNEAVRGASELLGLDPLYVANEGRMIAVVPERDVYRVLEVMASQPEAPSPAVVAKVTRAEGGRARVVAKNAFGGTRLLDLLSGEQLPRIC